MVMAYGEKAVFGLRDESMETKAKVEYNTLRYIDKPNVDASPEPISFPYRKICALL